MLPMLSTLHKMLCRLNDTTGMSSDPAVVRLVSRLNAALTVLSYCKVRLRSLPEAPSCVSQPIHGRLGYPVVCYYKPVSQPIHDRLGYPVVCHYKA